MFLKMLTANVLISIPTSKFYVMITLTLRRYLPFPRNQLTYMSNFPQSPGKRELFKICLFLQLGQVAKNSLFLSVKSTPLKAKNVPNIAGGA